MLTSFAIQTTAWGAFALSMAAAGWWRADLRVHAGAANLARLVYPMIALDAGMIGAGMILWARGGRARSLARVGAGVGMLAQGAGWLALHVAFATFLRDAT